MRVLFWKYLYFLSQIYPSGFFQACTNNKQTKTLSVFETKRQSGLFRLSAQIIACDMMTEFFILWLTSGIISVLD